MDRNEIIDLMSDALFAHNEWLKDRGKFCVFIKGNGSICVTGNEFPEKPEFFELSHLLGNFCDLIDNAPTKASAKLLVRELELSIKDIKLKIKEID